MNEIAREAVSAAPATPNDALLTKKELAARLKVTVRTVENWQRRGVLPYIKIGKVVLFEYSEVLEFLKANFRVCRRLTAT
jgi:excisionase family DNA binding protein